MALIFSDDRQVYHVYEPYQDSAAAMTHLESFGANFAVRFMEDRRIRVHTCLQTYRQVDYWPCHFFTPVLN
jgi:hypothetical protein